MRLLFDGLSQPEFFDLLSDQVFGDGHEIASPFSSGAFTPSLNRMILSQKWDEPLRNDPDDIPGDATTDRVLEGVFDASNIMGSVDDVDWFRLDVVEGLSYRISHYGPSRMTLVDADGNVVLNPTLGDATGITAEILSFVGQADTTLYVAVAGASTNLDGNESAFPSNYFLNYSEDEHRGDTQTIATLSVGNNVTGSIQSEADSDWIALTVEAGQDYRIKLGGLFDAVFDIVDANGVALTGQTRFSDQDFNSNVEFTASNSGTVYIRLDGSLIWDFGIGGDPYTLSLINEAGDTPDDTTTTQSVDPFGGTIADTIDTPDDRDWTRIELLAGDSLSLFVTFSSASALDLNLYDASGSLLASGLADGNQLATRLDGFDVTVSGTYYIEVAGNGNGTGSYTVQANTVRSDVPGDDTTTVFVNDGTTVSGAWDTTEDTDWYAYDGTPGTLARIDLDWNDNDFGILRVRDAQGNVLFTSENGTLIFEPPVQGRFYFEVLGDSQIAIGQTYQLSVSELQDDYSGGADTSGQISFETATTGRFEYASDSDWFAFSVEANQVATFRIDRTNLSEPGVFPTEQTIEIRNANGDLITDNVRFIQDENGFLEAFQIRLINAEPNDSYFLVINNVAVPGFEGNPSNIAYSITSNIYEEIPDDVTTQSALLPNGSVITAAHETSDDVDWFRFEVTDGDFLTFSFDDLTEFSTSDTVDLRLYDASGSLLRIFATAEDAQQVAFDEIGTYFLSVGNRANFGEAPARDYDISIQLAPPGTIRPEDLDNPLFESAFSSGLVIDGFGNVQMSSAQLSNGNTVLASGLSNNGVGDNVEYRQEIYLQIQNADGDPVGSEIPLIPPSLALYNSPKLVAYEGGFALLYLATGVRDVEGVETEFSEIIISYFDNSGTVTSTEPIVTVTGNSGAFRSSLFDVIALDDGSFAATMVANIPLQGGGVESTLYVLDIGPDMSVANGTLTTIDVTTNGSFEETEILLLADGSRLLTYLGSAGLQVLKVGAGEPYANLVPFPLTTDSGIVPAELAAFGDGFIAVGATPTNTNLVIQLFDANGASLTSAIETPIIQGFFSDADIAVMGDGSIIVVGPGLLIANTILGDTVIARYSADGTLLGEVITLSEGGAGAFSATLSRISDTDFSVSFATPDGVQSNIYSIDDLDRDFAFTEGADRINGSDRNDLIQTGEGGDTIIGGAGDDTLYGDFVRALSPDSFEAQVFRAYLAVFGRTPDEGGLNVYLTALRLGTIDQGGIISDFVGSAEFQATYGALSNEEFVELLYANVLPGNTDPVGRASYTASLDAGSLTRTEMVLEFVNAGEFVQRTTIESGAFGSSVAVDPAESGVFRLYQAIFNRDPDLGGFEVYVNALQGGFITLDAIATEFVASAEFQATYGALSNADFVELLYTNVLPGNQDQAGRDSYTASLDAGTLTRTDMVIELVESFEFLQATQDAAEIFRNRIFNNNDDTLSGGEGNDTLFGGRGADTFIYNVSQDDADIILDFTPGTDQISLTATGGAFDTLADILAVATQVGNDTLIDFGDGNTLRLQNVQRDALTAEDFGLTATASSAEKQSDTGPLVYEPEAENVDLLADDLNAPLEALISAQPSRAELHMDLWLTQQATVPFDQTLDDMIEDALI